MNENQSPKKIAIVGAGFSGMTLAFYLGRAGHQVTVFEKEKAGGLISTKIFQEMQVETAANAFLWTPELQEICQTIGCKLVSTLPVARNRFIWVNGLKKWPLGIKATCQILFSFLPKFIFNKKSVVPRPLESIQGWASRVLSQETLHNLIAPALQGIYAGDPSEMSASLILNPIFHRQKKSKDLHKPEIKGSCAPAEGMEDFFKKLNKYLKGQGISLIERSMKSNDLQSLTKEFDDVVIATAPWDAKELLSDLEPMLAKKFEALDYLPAVRVTIGFESPRKKIEGFGVLVVRDLGVRSLGVLSNTCIFPNRGPIYNESWILGGALDRNINQLSDEEIITQIQNDRGLILGMSGAPDKIVKYDIARWPRAFTHYDLDLERMLPLRPRTSNLHLTGNYLGRLGLTKILDANAKLAKVIGIKSSTEHQQGKSS